MRDQVAGPLRDLTTEMVTGAMQQPDGLTDAAATGRGQPLEPLTDTAAVGCERPIEQDPWGS